MRALRAHIAQIRVIKSDMFKDEIKSKLSASEVIPFSVCMLSKNKLVVSGVKSVAYASKDAIRLKLPLDALLIEGKDLHILEIGGADIYIKGEIGGLSFESREKKEQKD